jgi:hypothetical protein
MAYSELTCPKCSLKFKQESRFCGHLTDVHGIIDHLTLFLDGKQHPTCQCSATCQTKLPWAGWKKGFVSKYARGHNAKIDSVYLNKDKQKQFAIKRSNNYAAGKYKIWNKGLTKETSNIINESSKKIRVSLTNGLQTGKIATQKSSKTLAIAAKKTLVSYDSREVGNRLSVEQVLARIDAFSDKFELISDVSLHKTRGVDRLKLKCRASGHIQTKSLAMLEDTPVCFACHPKESKAQLEIFDFVKSLGVNAESCNKTVIAPKELDVYVPDHKLAIEYNGLYLHSAKMITDQKYHQKKLEMCAASKINLLNIYEDEWREKRPLIEKMIMHRLKKSTEVLDARKMNLVQIDPKASSLFFGQNHLEGPARSSITFALTEPNTGRIVAAMSLRRPFHNVYADSIEVARCCCLAGVSVRGWLGRLTKKSVEYARQKGVKSLMTYVDARVGAGTGYVNSGWTFVKTTGAPRFWWTDFHDRFNRFKYKADKSRNMTQQQIADEAGVVPIFGCINSVMKIDL